MSGHSHWSSIKHAKGEADAKRSQAFSKITRLIIIAVRQGGGDPEINARLRMAIEQGRKVNMPNDNIDRAIKKGLGETEGVVFEELLLEAYGPAGAAIIIECITDNRNRTINDVKSILSQNGGKLASEGSVRWMFDRKGVVIASLEKQKTEMTKDTLELEAIDQGAENLSWDDGSIEIYTKADELEKVKKGLEEKGIAIESASLDWVAKETIQAGEKEKETTEKIFEALNDNDAVQEVYSNLGS